MPSPHAPAEGLPLLPCPFCGGRAKLCSYSSCDCCGAAYNAGVMCLSTTCGATADHFRTDAEAIAAWNRREALRAAGGVEALQYVREMVTQEDESAFGYGQVNHGSGIHRAYSVRGNLLAGIDRQIEKLTTPSPSEPAQGEGWPFVEEIGTNGKPTGYWLRKGCAAAARNCVKPQPPAQGDMEAVAGLCEKLDRFAEHTRRTSKGGMEAEARAFEEAAATIRNLASAQHDVEASELAEALDKVAASYTDCKIKRNVERAAAKLRQLGKGGVQVDEAMVKRAANCQPLTAANDATRFWQMLPNDIDAIDTIRLVLTAALGASDGNG